MKENKKQRWSIRKTKIAVGSVFIGTLVVLGIGQENDVLANEIGNTNIESITSEDNANKLVSSESKIQEDKELKVTNETSSTTNGMTYFEEKEIQTSSKTIEISKEETDEDCIKKVTKKTEITKISYDFEAIAEIGPDGSIIKKVKSPENKAHDHSNPTYAEQYGPLDLEWNPKFGINDTYRVNFGTNYAIENAKLTLTLPVEGYTFGQDATNWLINRYYNNTNGKSNYDYLVYFVKDKTDEEILELNKSSERIIYFKAPIISSDNKTFEIDLGTLPARTAFSLQFFRDKASLGEVEHMTGPIAKLKGSFVFDKGIVLPSSTQTSDLLDKEDKREAGRTTLSTWTSKSDDVIKTGDVTAAGEEVITKNGYEYEVKTTTEIIRANPDQCGCDKIIMTKEITNNFKINAESVMDPTLPDYSNNGYLIKVANKNNHINVEEGSAIEGPANAEIQHWQTTSNGTTTQYWRPVLALDYASENGKWIINLPYEVTKADISDASGWLTDRYYPAVTGKKYYSNYGTITGVNILDKITILGKQVIVDLADIPARTAMALVISKTFETPENLKDNPYKTSYTFEGSWNFNDIKLPSTTIIETIECSCECTPKDKDINPKPTPTPDPEEKPSTKPEEKPEPKPTPEKIEKKLSNTGEETKSTSYAGLVGLILATIIVSRKRRNK